MMKSFPKAVRNLVTLVLIGSGSLFGQPAELEPGDLDLADRVEARFEVLLLSDGVLLESHQESALSARRSVRKAPSILISRASQ